MDGAGGRGSVREVFSLKDSTQRLHFVFRLPPLTQKEKKISSQLLSLISLHSFSVEVPFCERFPVAIIPPCKFILLKCPSYLHLAR